MRTCLLTLLLAACPAPVDRDTDTDTDADTDTDEGLTPGCLAFVGTVDLFSASGDDAQEGFPLRNDCGFAVDVVLDWARPATPLSIVSATEFTLQPFRTAVVDVRFSPTGTGSGDAVLRASAPDRNLDDALGTVSYDAPGIALALGGLPEAGFVYSCPTPVDLEVTNVGQGSGEIVSLDFDITQGSGEVFDDLVSLPAESRPGGSLKVPATLTLDARADGVTVELSALEAFSGFHEVSATAGRNTEADRQLDVPWQENIQLDVLVTVDRSMGSPDALRARLRDVVAELDKQALDVRMVGLRTSDGCPLGRSGAAESSMGVDAMIDRLDGQLDLAYNRHSGREYDERHLDLVMAALADANVEVGGCNDWRRTRAPLLVLHMGDADDASTTRVGPYLLRLQALVPLEDRVAVAVVAGLPPDGCEGVAAARRLADVVRGSGGTFVDWCAGPDAAAMSTLVRQPGDPWRVRLAAEPYEPSLRATVEGISVDATWDGEAVVIERPAYEPESEDLRIEWVAAEDCPAG